MATFITTTSIVAGVRTLVNGDDQHLYILSGVTYASMDDAVIATTLAAPLLYDFGANNFGSLLSGGARTVFLENMSGASFINHAGASISSSAFSAGASTFEMQGPGVSLTNAGTISTSLIENAVRLTGDQVTLNNSGTIEGGRFAVTIDGGGFAAFNSGTISVSRTASGAAVRLNLETGASTFTNSGEIIALRGVAITVNAPVFGFPTGTVDIVNTGTIHALSGDGIVATGFAALNVQNDGVIRSGGTYLAISGGAAIDVVTNRGQIAGTVSLGLGDDVFDTIGGTVGFVLGGGGSDTYFVSDVSVAIFEAAIGDSDAIYSTVDFTLTAAMGEIENLTLIGNAQRAIGNDIGNAIAGNDEANLIMGLGGNDFLYGGIGHDTIDGGGGSDSIYGGAGDDIIIDASGVERLFGDDGNDFISAGSSGDRLYGGDGDDTLLGGVGADLLYGGADQDTFEFRRAIESTTSQRDQIVGFENGIDVIDMSRIDAVQFVTGNQAFTYIGGASFSNVAGELRFYTSGANGRIAGDTNGDSIADFEVQLTGVTILFADSLIL